MPRPPAVPGRDWGALRAAVIARIVAVLRTAARGLKSWSAAMPPPSARMRMLGWLRAEGERLASWVAIMPPPSARIWGSVLVVGTAVAAGVFLALAVG
ncbi:MAG: hypothetical protein ACRDGV_00650 [Candidatus Limnocylindria bacterium]